MNERLVCWTFTAEAQADADGVHAWQVPVGVDIVYITVCAEAFTGSPTGFNIDVQDDASDVITAVAANTAGTPGTWKAYPMGGANDPVHVEAGSALEIDVNLVGGSSPTADYTIQIWALTGEA